MFQKIGIFEEYPNQEDLGRYEITKREADKMVFKVPSLRNIAKTAPYFRWFYTYFRRLCSIYSLLSTRKIFRSRNS